MALPFLNWAAISKPAIVQALFYLQILYRVLFTTSGKLPMRLFAFWSFSGFLACRFTQTINISLYWTFYKQDWMAVNEGPRDKRFNDSQWYISYKCYDY